MMSFFNELFITIRLLIKSAYFWMCIFLLIVLQTGKTDIIDKLLINLPQISGFVGTVIGFYAGQKSGNKKAEEEKITDFKKQEEEK